MTARPILFSGPMVRALLAGRKTQTRRLKFKAEPGDLLWVKETWALETSASSDDPLPFDDGRPIKRRSADDADCIEPSWAQPHYRATDPEPTLTCENDWCAQCRDHEMGPHWRPSIFMPRWASRITLEVTEVRTERLHDISCADAVAEGVPEPHHVDGCEGHGCKGCHLDAVRAYWDLWDSLNGERPGASWADDPIVTVITFRVHKGNVDAVARESALHEMAAIGQAMGDYAVESEA